MLLVKNISIQNIRFNIKTIRYQESESSSDTIVGFPPYSSCINDVHNNIEDYNPIKISFEDMFEVKNSSESNIFVFP